MIHGMAIALAILAAEPGDKADGKSLFQPDKFQTLVDPDCSYCKDEAKRAGGELKADDRVLAWIRGDHGGGAVPYRWFLVPHRVISDTYGVFVFDPDAGFVRGWPASVDFRFHGWRNGVMVMKHKDGTLFDCLTGLAFEGPRKGEQLKPLPTIETLWGPWLKQHPGTVAYEMKPVFKPFPLPAGVLAESRKTRPQPDPRLDSEERVFGLSVAGASQAWPLVSFGKERLARPVRVGNSDALLLWDPATQTAVAFAPETEGGHPEKVTLIAAPADAPLPFVDRETGSHWSIDGRAMSGSRQGQSLRWLPGVMVKWYAWAADYAQTGLVK